MFGEEEYAAVEAEMEAMREEAKVATEQTLAGLSKAVLEHGRLLSTELVRLEARGEIAGLVPPQIERTNYPSEQAHLGNARHEMVELLVTVYEEPGKPAGVGMEISASDQRMNGQSYLNLSAMDQELTPQGREVLATVAQRDPDSTLVWIDMEDGYRETVYRVRADVVPDVSLGGYTIDWDQPIGLVGGKLSRSDMLLQEVAAASAAQIREIQESWAEIPVVDANGLQKLAEQIDASRSGTSLGDQVDRLVKPGALASISVKSRSLLQTPGRPLNGRIINARDDELGPRGPVDMAELILRRNTLPGDISQREWRAGDEVFTELDVHSPWAESTPSLTLDGGVPITLTERGAHNLNRLDQISATARNSTAFREEMRVTSVWGRLEERSGGLALDQNAMVLPGREVTRVTPLQQSLGQRVLAVRQPDYVPINQREGAGVEVSTPAVTPVVKPATPAITQRHSASAGRTQREGGFEGPSL